MQFDAAIDTCEPLALDSDLAKWLARTWDDGVVRFDVYRWSRSALGRPIFYLVQNRDAILNWNVLSNDFAYPDAIGLRGQLQIDNVRDHRARRGFAAARGLQNRVRSR